MSDGLPVVDDDAAQAALHGSFCPKMCTFACPVTAATGRADAVPWSFHRTVSDLAAGRLAASPTTGSRLVACSGCLACRVPCLFDQDVPAQVRAGRATLHEAGQAPAPVAAAVDRCAVGRSPYEPLLERMLRPSAATEDDGERSARLAAATVVVVPGCRDDAGTVQDALRLLTAAGERPAAVVPRGCCGSTLEDLGARSAARDAGDALARDLADAPARVVALDPHCLPQLRRTAADGTEVRHVVEELTRLLADGRLRLHGDLGRVAYHDPCLLSRGEGLVEQPRALLRAAGATVIEPEHSGTATACSGAGLALELLDGQAAEATAAARRVALTATGATAVTACSGARRRLAADGTAVDDLLHLLVRSLPEDAA